MRAHKFLIIPSRKTIVLGENRNSYNQLKVKITHYLYNVQSINCKAYMHGSFLDNTISFM